MLVKLGIVVMEQRLLVLMLKSMLLGVQLMVLLHTTLLVAKMPAMPLPMIYLVGPSLVVVLLLLLLLLLLVLLLYKRRLGQKKVVRHRLLHNARSWLKHLLIGRGWFLGHTHPDP